MSTQPKEHAEACLHRAQVAKGPLERALCLKMAHAWLQLDRAQQRAASVLNDRVEKPSQTH